MVIVGVTVVDVVKELPPVMEKVLAPFAVIVADCPAHIEEVDATVIVGLTAVVIVCVTADPTQPKADVPVNV